MLKFTLLSLLFVTIASESRVPFEFDLVEVFDNRNETRSIFNGANIEDVLNHKITGENYYLLIQNSKRNFSSVNRRISEVKCLEYIWKARVQENLSNYITDGWLSRYIKKECKENIWKARGQGKFDNYIDRNCFNDMWKMAVHSNVTVLLMGAGDENFVLQTNASVAIIVAFNCKESHLKAITITIGGRPAFQGELPHMGAVGWRSASNNLSRWVFKCGASLISEKFMLTAAHCSSVPKRDKTVANTKPEVVKVGDKFLIETEMQKFMSKVNGKTVSKDTLAKYVRIERFIKHENYHSPNLYYDIALLELAESLEFNSRIRPICLWGNEETDPEEKLSISGWGVVDALTRETTTELQVANISIIDSDNCNELLKYRRSRNWQGLTDHQICAGHLSGGIDTCEGDSGGPLQAKINLAQEWHMYYLVGITSFGYSCASPNIPSVYTRTVSFIDWIENIVWPPDKK